MWTLEVTFSFQSDRARGVTSYNSDEERHYCPLVSGISLIFVTVQLTGQQVAIQDIWQQNFLPNFITYSCMYVLEAQGRKGWILTFTDVLTTYTVQLPKWIVWSSKNHPLPLNHYPIINCKRSWKYTKMSNVDLS